MCVFEESITPVSSFVKFARVVGCWRANTGQTRKAVAVQFISALSVPECQLLLQLLELLLQDGQLQLLPGLRTCSCC